MKEYYEKNKERINEQCRQYYQEHKEEIKERNHKYYQENKEKVKRQHQSQHEKLACWQREYRKNNLRYKAHGIWRMMLKRCGYDVHGEQITSHDNYVDCHICEEWFDFDNFYDWFQDNYYEIENQSVNLDKDLLSGDKKMYSPSTCCFLPKEINIVLGHCGHMILGKYNNSGKIYCHAISDGVTSKRLFADSIEEVYDFVIGRHNTKVRLLAEKYKDVLPANIYNVLSTIDFATRVPIPTQDELIIEYYKNHKRWYVAPTKER